MATVIDANGEYVYTPTKNASGIVKRTSLNTLLAMLMGIRIQLR